MTEHHFNFVEDYPKIKTIKEAKAWICTNDPDFKPDEVISFLPLKTCRQILDFGCGVGRNLAVLLELKPYGIFGYDHPNMIELAKQYLGLENWNHVTWLKPPVQSILDFKFDLVISTLVFMHMRESDLLAALPVIAHSLTESGLMYVHCRSFTDDRKVLVWPLILKYFEPVKIFTLHVDLLKLEKYAEPKVLLRVRQ